MDKPTGWAKFDKLAREIVEVPKEKVEQKIAQNKATRKARRKSK
jgi:hypothetical protein